ncbi:hypothetical protein ACO2Q0_02490 [Phenylobacterium sp. VNQ135]
MDHKDRTGKAPATSKEAKLAAALRANLRRRKSGGAVSEKPSAKNRPAD